MTIVETPLPSLLVRESPITMVSGPNEDPRRIMALVTFEVRSNGQSNPTIVQNEKRLMRQPMFGRDTIAVSAHMILLPACSITLPAPKETKPNDANNSW